MTTRGAGDRIGWIFFLAMLLLAQDFSNAQIPVSTPEVSSPDEATVSDTTTPATTLSGPQLIPPPLLPLVPKSTASSSITVASDAGSTTFEISSAAAEYTPAAVLPEQASSAMLDFLASLVRDSIPEKHLDEKDWNRTKKFYAGIKFRREGLKLETERRWKTVNHGLWKKYEVQLIAPEKTLDVRLSNVHWQPDGRLHARLTIVSELLVNVWQTQWNLGVRVYAIQSEARVRMVMDLDATVGFRLDPATLPPALVVDPHIEDASLRMASFHVNRIGNLGGDVAEELGEAAEGLVRKLLVQPQSEKLASKLNRQIDKKRDLLRIDAGDWLNRWFHR